ncbi:hypothetical protein [uncultured Zobellia sp.]|uniref:hypothetical protein n=1 Tax=uncultured Zobellia sp. TaxID=255433 RepID=UPI0025925C69|nr:hypothetical protein [uncultured Zobellia sp.]
MFSISVLSCQDSNNEKEIGLNGTWHYARRSKPEIGFTMKIDGEDVVEESNDAPEDGDDIDHFYLVFDNQGQMIQYKVGIGFCSKYNIVDNTIYSNEEPLYQISGL